MLSRNFKLQKVGDVNWLQRNYNFSSIASSLDELVILDISRDSPDQSKFFDTVDQIVEGCFMPLSLGGKINEPRDVERALEHGADKVVINSAIHSNPEFISELAKLYGSQFIVASIDFKFENGLFQAYSDNGSKVIEQPLEKIIDHATNLGAGEIYLNSMDKDGTGQGFHFQVLDYLMEKTSLTTPVIMAGGAGNYAHLSEGLQKEVVDAVATANLFNFVGNGIPSARAKLLESGLNLARW